ncbi:MAG: undecaprenyldiphospho-muramoylpentapeptide beta-N-acetylglucosaminyltransferase [Abditibacteriota bacterium]|nr:undecaprenyldiphospho-muramoylpentapeptide beta-N-acetylglucosaminyltransferase [Abditibacteriota bacterium]
MNIVLTGGGTGGHVYPAISIAQTLKDLDEKIKILYIGSSSSIEERVSASHNIDFIGVHSASLPEIKSFKCLKAIKDVAQGVVEAKKALDSFDCDLVFGTGGYVCYPVFIAQKMRKKPIVIHEQNAIGGKTNKEFAKYATYICTTFDNKDFPLEKIVQTGLPIRKSFKIQIPKKYYSEDFGIPKDKFVILVCGGSQGAKAINDTIVEILPQLKDENIEIIHQTGKKKYEDVINATKGIEAHNYHPYDYIDMYKALNVADLVIGRAGASTLTEILTQGVPSVLIPFPYAASNHQFYNAKHSSDEGASILIEEKNLKGEELLKIIKDLIQNPEKLREMSLATEKVIIPNPEEKIVEVIFKTLNK